MCQEDWTLCCCCYMATNGSCDIEWKQGTPYIFQDSSASEKNIKCHTSKGMKLKYMVLSPLSNALDFKKSSSWCIYYKHMASRSFYSFVYDSLLFHIFITFFYVNKFSPSYGLQRKKNWEWRQMWNTWLSNCILYIWKNVYDVLINWQKKLSLFTAQLKKKG